MSLEYIDIPFIVDRLRPGAQWSGTAKSYEQLLSSWQDEKSPPAQQEIITAWEFYEFYKQPNWSEFITELLSPGSVYYQKIQSFVQTPLQALQVARLEMVASGLRGSFSLQSAGILAAHWQALNLVFSPEEAGLLNAIAIKWRVPIRVENSLLLPVTEKPRQ